jgi:hypothetical protein
MGTLEPEGTYAQARIYEGATADLVITRTL